MESFEFLRPLADRPAATDLGVTETRLLQRYKTLRKSGAADFWQIGILRFFQTTQPRLQLKVLVSIDPRGVHA